MITLYKQRFLKVFLTGLILLIIGGGGMIWSVQYIYFITSSDVANVSQFGLIKVVLSISALTLLVGEILYIYSHYLLAKGKGYSGWLILLALINIFGLLVLLLLPDRRKEGKI